MELSSEKTGHPIRAIPHSRMGTQHDFDLRGANRAFEASGSIATSSAHAFVHDHKQN